MATVAAGATTRGASSLSATKTQLLTGDRPSPDDFQTSRRIHGHTGPKPPVAAPVDKFFTLRAGTPLPPPPRAESKSPTRRAAYARSAKPATPPQAVEPGQAVPRSVADAMSPPVIVEYKAEPNGSKNVHVNDRKQRGASRNILGGFFTS